MPTGLLLCLKLVQKSVRLVNFSAKSKASKGTNHACHDVYPSQQFCREPNHMVIGQAMLGLDFACCSFQTPFWLRLGGRQRVSNGSVTKTISTPATRKHQIANFCQFRFLHFAENAHFWWRMVCSHLTCDQLEACYAKKDLRNELFRRFCVDPCGF